MTEGKKRKWRVPLVTLIVNDNPTTDLEIIEVIEKSAHDAIESRLMTVLLDLENIKFDKASLETKLSEYEGAHSCSVKCERPLCVANRKLARALDKIATAQIALGEKDYIWTDSLIGDAIKELESTK